MSKKGLVESIALLVHGDCIKIIMYEICTLKEKASLLMLWKSTIAHAIESFSKRMTTFAKKCLSVLGTILSILSGEMSAVSQDRPRSQALPMQAVCLLHIRPLISYSLRRKL